MLHNRDYLTLNNFELSEVLIALLKEHLHTLLNIDEEMKRSIPSLTRQLLPEFAIYTDCIEVDSSKYVMKLPTMYVYKMKMKPSTGINQKLTQNLISNTQIRSLLHISTCQLIARVICEFSKKMLFHLVNVFLCTTVLRSHVYFAKGHPRFTE